MHCNFYYINPQSPVAMHVDWINDKIYWSDYGAGRIEAADLDGKNRVILVERNHTKYRPLYLAVDPHKR